MKYKQRKEIIKHIQLGTTEVLYFPYEGKYPLPLRPISSYEFDDCFYKALKHTPDKIAELVIKLKLKLIDKDREINVSSGGYADLQKFYDSIDYWIVYHSMKDFQDPEFTKPDYENLSDYPKGYFITLKMKEIHEIANFVVDSSYQTEDVIKEIFEDDFGREIAYVVTFLKQPLADVPKLTRLQKKYLIHTKEHLPGILKGKSKEKGYIISGKTMTMEEFLNRF